MTAMTYETLLQDPEIQAFFSPDAVQLYQAEAPVGAWAIQAWCRVMEDRNPVYRDRDAARRYGYQDIIAPPVMMHSFTFPGLTYETEDNLLNRLRRKLETYGINSVVAGNYEQEFLTPIRLGDMLTREVRFESISEEKLTAVGTGHFILMGETIYNQDRVLIGRQKMRTLFFRPGKGKDPALAQQPAKKEAETPPAAPRLELPPLAIPLTTTRIVCGAIAANDFEKVHHDRDLAQAQGLKDIIMNILTSCGLAMRYVTDWAGPAAIVKSHSSRFGVPNYPGDTMTFTATADGAFAPGRETQIQLRGANSLGAHINSTITIG